MSRRAVFVRIMALRMVSSSLRMHAVRASFLGLPAIVDPENWTAA
jgi:hypothetical protein